MDITTTTSGVPVTGSSTQGIKTVLHPVSDLATAKAVYAALLGVPPQTDGSYGMPAYAQDGKVVCYFQSADKFKSRDATFGFNDTAHLDEGTTWPTSFALKELTGTEETKIGALVKRAVS
jgi:hypothetical protein